MSTAEVDTGKEVHQLKVPWDPGQNPRAVISRDGSTLAWIVQYKGPIHLSDTSTGAEIGQIAIENYEQPASFADDTKRLITVSIPDRTVRLREIATGAVVQQFVLPIPQMGGFGKTFSAAKMGPFASGKRPVARNCTGLKGTETR